MPPMKPQTRCAICGFFHKDELSARASSCGTAVAELQRVLPLSNTSIMERVSGPIKGYYIATLACPIGDAQSYVAYGRLCPFKPRSFWEADARFEAHSSERSFGDLAAAHRVAYGLAISELRTLEPVK